MPNTLTASTLDDLVWDEVVTAISALRRVDGADKAVARLVAWQADNVGFNLHSAERQLEPLVHQGGLERGQAEALTEALVRLGRAMAFRQVAYRL